MKKRIAKLLRPLAIWLFEPKVFKAKIKAVDHKTLLEGEKAMERIVADAIHRLVGQKKKGLVFYKKIEQEDSLEGKMYIWRS